MTFFSDNFMFLTSVKTISGSLISTVTLQKYAVFNTRYWLCRYTGSIRSLTMRFVSTLLPVKLLR